MSHTMNIRMEIHDRAALDAACRRLGITTKEGEHQLFATKETGTALYLKGWTFPAVVKSDGSIAFDNYGGAWGDEARLHEFQAYYGLEKAKMEAMRMGYTCTESQEGKNLVLRIQEV
ncbi:MAG: hypothetical protein PHY31_10215 [Smithellaceae bacterium]|nr:hypothetical protein [Smithellaceae bacterium]